MHPSRAAKIAATIGAALLFAALVLRALSIGYTLSALGTQVQADAPDLPPVGSYQIINGGTEILFRQGDADNPQEQPRWYSMPVEGGTITPWSVPQLPPDLQPLFEVADGAVRLQRQPAAQPVTVSPANETVMEATPSPDGNALAFTTQLSGERWRLYVADSSGDLVWIGEEAVYYDLDWSPDSEALAFIAPRQGVDQVFSVDADGQNYRSLTSGPMRKSSPRWSPDGAVIAYTAANPLGEEFNSIGQATPTPAPLIMETGGAQPYTLQYQGVAPTGAVHAVDADGGNQRVLAEPATMPYNPGWIVTEDGMELAYAARLVGQASTAFLYAADLKGGTRQVYPPVSLDALECPAAFPVETGAVPRLTLSNSGRVPIDLPLMLSAQGSPIAYGETDSSEAQRLETVTLLPGEPHVFEWPVQAARAALIRPGEGPTSGRVTYVSAAPNLEPPFPIRELHCSAPNTYLGLPNLPVLWATLPMMLVGMLLCVPRLMQVRRGLWWFLWGASLIVFLILAAFEARINI